MAQPLPAYRGSDPYVFVSYAHADEDAVFAEIRWLQDQGVNVWYDTTGIGPGREWNDEIARAIKGADQFLYFISPSSIASEHCRRELNFAQSENRRVVVAHLEETELPDGLRLSLDNRQAILKDRLSVRDYQNALLRSLAPDAVDLTTTEARATSSGTVKRHGVGPIGIAMILILGVAWWYFERSSDVETVAQVGDGKPAIAILPFINLSKDPTQSFFADGVAEQILNLLSGNPNLRVVSRSSSFWFKGKDVDIPTVVSKLRVTYVLEGSVMQAGDKLRITAQLIDGQSDAHLWSGTYDRELNDVFAIQDDIAARVAEQLNIALQGSPAERPANTDAYLLVLQARHLLSEDKQDNLRRVEALLDQALQTDPDYVPALNELARLNWQKRWSGLEPREESLQQYLELLQRALAVDPDNAVATLGLGWAALEIDGDLAAALTFVRRAIELDATQTPVLHPSAPFMLWAGRIEDAIAIGEHVVPRDPLSIIPINNLGGAYLRAGRFDAAEAQFENVLALDPGSDEALAGLCKLELLRGNAQRAHDLADRIHDPNLRTPLLASALFSSGRLREAEEVLGELRDRWPEASTAVLSVAHVYAWEGDSDNAFAWLARALDAREEVSLPLYLVLTDPMWKAHHADPRWRTFLEEMGQLPEQLAASYFALRLPD